jgi:hypothetical protein
VGERVRTDFIAAGRAPAAISGERAGGPVRARRALLRELEASLEGSRKALLALDLAGIERGTREQEGLLREFEAVLRHRMNGAAHAPEPEGEPGPEPEPEPEEETRRSGNRILEAARLQAALLVRAQCKLRVLANMLAGPSVTYGPPRRGMAGWRVALSKRGGAS